jgi:hypothetical protein
MSLGFWQIFRIVVREKELQSLVTFGHGAGIGV